MVRRIPPVISERVSVEMLDTRRLSSPPPTQVSRLMTISRKAATLTAVLKPRCWRIKTTAKISSSMTNASIPPREPLRKIVDAMTAAVAAANMR